MENHDFQINDEDLNNFRERGYNDDLLPKRQSERNMGIRNYFTLWMGSIHNIPNYAAVGGFLFLGLSPINVVFALILSAVVVAVFLSLNGVAGSKYGIPFSIHLRSTYGALGAKLPGFLRGCVAAIAWFGLQNYTGSQALLILIGKLWPGFLRLGGETKFFGISIPGLISFTIFWAINVLIGLGGGKILNRFTAILSPLIYIVFGGMAIWAVNAAGGIGAIFSYRAVETSSSVPPVLIYLMIINSVLAVWAAPGASVADFTQNAKSTKAQMIGQMLSMVVGYAIFALFSVVILIGGSIRYGTQEWNVLNIIEQWDNLPAVILTMAVFLLTTISTNATGNIIPAGYQILALLPKKINYRKGVIIAGIISFVIMPWKLMERSDSIYVFLNAIGAILGPVAGVMIAHFFFSEKQELDLNQLYMDKTTDNTENPYVGINRNSYIATIIAVVLCLSGQFIPVLSGISDYLWLVGFFFAFVLYLILDKLWPVKRTGVTSNKK